MSYTFICTKDNEWYLKISNIEQLLDYWNTIFNPKLKNAIETILDTKEWGKGVGHCDNLQMLIGFKAKSNHMTYEEAFEEITHDTRIAQYQALSNNKNIYINSKMGWNTEQKEVDQFVHKKDMNFPVMKSEKIKIKQFPMGTHYYVYIDGVQLRKGDKLKFNSYDEAYNYAKSYVK